MLHAAFVRSPYAHARIVSIDTGDAASMPGILRVLTASDLNPICTPWTGTLSHFRNMKSPPQSPLPTTKAVWSGQPVVMLLGGNRAEAEDAAEMVWIEWEELDPVIDPVAALEAAPIHPSMGDNIVFRSRIESWRSFTPAAEIVECDIRFGRHTAVTMEPRCILADYDPTEQC